MRISDWSSDVCSSDLIFEIGVYDFDKAYIVMPMEDAQLLLLTGDQVQMIEVKTEDPDRVGEILQPLAEKLAAKAVVSDWRSMNASLFEALSIERVDRKSTRLNSSH